MSAPVYRVRYSRGKHGQRKNTLVTFRIDGSDVVFWGVARCALKADKFDAATGKALALERCLEAVQAYGGKLSLLQAELEDNQAVMLLTNQRAGVVNFHQRHLLLDYFDRIDEIGASEIFYINFPDLPVLPQ